MSPIPVPIVPIILTIKTRDDRGFYGKLHAEEADHYKGSIFEQFTLRDALKAKTGKAVLKVISEIMDPVAKDAHYPDGFFSGLEEQMATISLSGL